MTRLCIIRSSQTFKIYLLFIYTNKMYSRYICHKLYGILHYMPCLNNVNYKLKLNGYDTNLVIYEHCAHTVVYNIHSCQSVTAHVGTCQHIIGMYLQFQFTQFTLYKYHVLFTLCYTYITKHIFLCFRAEDGVLYHL